MTCKCHSNQTSCLDSDRCRCPNGNLQTILTCMAAETQQLGTDLNWLTEEIVFIKFKQQHTIQIQWVDNVKAALTWSVTFFSLVDRGYSTPADLKGSGNEIVKLFFFGQLFNQ